MSNFKKHWIKERKVSISDRIKEGVSPSGPLRPKIDDVSRALDFQVAKLNAAGKKLKDKETSIFNQLVESNEKRDIPRSNILANELAQIRKTSVTIDSSNAALEQLSIRMKTIQNFGDVAVALSPVFGTIRKIQSGLSGIVPQATEEFTEIGDLVNDLMTDAGEMGGNPMKFEANNEEAERILAEASVMAEKKMRDSLPSIPTEEVDDHDLGSSF